MKVPDEITHIFDKTEISENTTFIWDGDFNMLFDINLDADGGGGARLNRKLNRIQSFY